MHHINQRRLVSIWLIVLAFVVAAPQAALAHKISIFAHAQKDSIYSESYFFNGAPCKGCTVKVYDHTTNKFLLEGKTDDDGLFTFTAPKAPVRPKKKGKPAPNSYGTVYGIVWPLRLELDAGVGHDASYVLEDEELQSESLTIEIPPETTPGIEKEIIIPSITADCGHDIDAIVASEMAPLKAELSRLRREAEEPGFTEIFGGIGYIFGIFGIWAYIKSRKLGKSGPE